MACIYCGSNNYGRVCIFSPTQTHVHADDPNKCIYCGSTNYGNGCNFNPTGKMHVKAAGVFAHMKEQVEKSAILTKLLESISQTPDKNYKSPLDRMYKRLAGIIQNFSEPLLEAFAMQEMPVLEKMDESQRESITIVSQRLEENINDLKKTLKYANNALPEEIVEKLLVSAISSK